MCGKILGIDLGTNSTGLTLRDTDKEESLFQDQLVFFSSIIFKAGVGSEKGIEFSYAGKRRDYRLTRNRYFSKKECLWATLKCLIDYGYCPLSLENLHKWSCYDKKKGLFRQYPVADEAFDRWIKLDFDGDNKPDYTSPYQLRRELATVDLDMTLEINRFKLGRALYHIAQRRGFKSSKGETIAEQEDAQKDSKQTVDSDNYDILGSLKKSEETKSLKLREIMDENGCPTAGCAFALLEDKKIRIRNSEYSPVRSLLKAEIIAIFNKQRNIPEQLKTRILSEKKKDGTIFYKKPLKSQRGNVGKCLLEPSKNRCPIGHYEFEKFRALGFINNIQYKESPESNWVFLSSELRKKLFNEKFISRLKTNFKFEEIRVWLEKQLNLHLSKENSTINYADHTNVAGCPISARLERIFGKNWLNINIESSKNRIDKRTGETHPITYSINDIWNIAYSSDDMEYIEQFASSLELSDTQTADFIKLWGNIPQGYSNLSLKAIQNINHFLEKGFIYSHATLLAKIPDIVGIDLWEKQHDSIIADIRQIGENMSFEKQAIAISNKLISDYKSLTIENQFAYKDPSYSLQNSDMNDVITACSNFFGATVWGTFESKRQESLSSKVADFYQQFFASAKRDYIKAPKIETSIKKYLSDTFPSLHCDNMSNGTPCNCNICKQINQLYHPSMIEVYKPAKEQVIEKEGKLIATKLLESPVISALKNPMAMRTLHILRRKINDLILKGMIDEDTKIVVETARDLNDANKRWAIRAYQNAKEAERKSIEKIIQEYNPSDPIKENDVRKAQLLIEQIEEDSIIKFNSFDKQLKENVKKYKLWLEQKGRCIYTDKIINLSALLNGNFDIEHTIPRSLFPDDSLANNTLCDPTFNRDVKKNKIPSHLSEETYARVLKNIQPWRDRIVRIKGLIENWKAKSSRSTTKEAKDNAIRQRLIWQMELEYWQRKVATFLVKDVTPRFKNSQLVDTRIISKYAFHYLKSVFNNVDVEKGSITSLFRKILGIQQLDEVKIRDNHAHHAIDAAVLTLIPSSAKRDRMISLFYKIAECNHLKHDYSQYSLELNQMIKSLNIGSLSNFQDFIMNNIFIDHQKRDNVLTPAHKKTRKRGKEIFIINNDGSYSPKWISGDCIRGELHKQTFLGAMKKACVDETSHTPIRDNNGNIITSDEISYTTRKELSFKANAMASGFASWDELEKAIVNKQLIPMMKSQFPDGTSFKDAVTEGIFMLNKNGEKVNRIRHIRCFTRDSKPLQIKQQTYASKFEYKNFYYAAVGDLYAMCLYSNKDNSIKDYRAYNLFQLSENMKFQNDAIPKIVSGKKGNTLYLREILRAGDMILLYENCKEELTNLGQSELSKRLYVITGFDAASKRVFLYHHLKAGTDNISWLSLKDFKHLDPTLRCTMTKIKFIVRGTDFEITTSGIQFL